MEQGQTLAMAGVKRSFEAMLGSGNPLLQSDHTNGYGSRSKVQRPTSPGVTETRAPTDRPPLPRNASGPHNFHSNASMVLVGIRGAGKSTLAIIASSAMNRRVIDLETIFQRICGVSSSGYKARLGIQQCRSQQASMLQDVITNNSTDCVIVCPWVEPQAQKLLRDFASTHPVIHIVRDSRAIQSHLKIWDREKMQSLLSISRTVFQGCTNFEFFNVSEPPVDFPELPSPDYSYDRPSVPYLTLKKAEKHFLKFLSLIYPPGTIRFNESVFPLANVKTEERHFTYVLSVPISEILHEEFDPEDCIEGVDAVQVLVGDVSDDPGSYQDNLGEITDRITRSVGVIRRGTVLPVMVHIGLPESANEERVRHYADLVSHTLRLAPEFVTVNLCLDDQNIGRIFTLKGRSNVVGDCFISHDPPSWDSPVWESLYRKACRLGCDMVRLVRPATSMADNFAVERFRISMSTIDCNPVPLIAFNTGPLGRTSACFNPLLTTVVPKSHLQLDHNDPAACCLTARSATEALCSAFVYDKMKLYVFGMNVGYSASPSMHNSALRACGLPHRYRPHSTNSLSAIKHLISDPYFGGASVGLPFKVEFITLIHSLSRHAQAIGAVNTLIPIRHLKADGSIPQGGELFNELGRAGPVKALYGENTDWIGIRDCIRRGLSPANAVRPTTTGVVVGAGGMARAAVYSLLQVGVHNIVIHNRTLSNAKKMSAHFEKLLEKPQFQLLGAGSNTSFHVIEAKDDPWPSQFNLPTIIISCIPTHRIGNVPAPDFTVPESWLGSRTGGVIVELGYKSLDTPLLKQARKEAHRGWVTMTGLDLLPVQGFAQFELFTGKRAPRNVMKMGMQTAFTKKKGYPLAELESGMPSEEEDDSR